MNVPKRSFGTFNFVLVYSLRFNYVFGLTCFYLKLCFFENNEKLRDTPYKEILGSLQKCAYTQYISIFELCLYIATVLYKQ
ncbi:hypothetical protein EON70_00470 [bacterium]|nr:MAG: hypothetical protein EON70_00470 [bacterium]